MEPEEIACRVYREMGLPEPRVRRYPSAAEAIADFSSWRHDASPLVAVSWEYQYPVLNPDSYWATYHLYKEGFQLDLTRQSNGHGCYVTPRYISTIPISPELLYRRYFVASIAAVAQHPQSETSKVDEARRDVVAGCDGFMNELSDMLDQKDPTDQMGMESYMFLGGFRWLRIERDILRDMRYWVQKPVCDEHYQNVKLLCELDGLFFTFRRLVLWVPLPKLGIRFPSPAPTSAGL